MPRYPPDPCNRTPSLQLQHVKAHVAVDKPSADLNFVSGTVHYVLPGEAELSEAFINITNVMLRGCLLKNTGFVIGLVLYTGKESRIQKNSSTSTPVKYGVFDRFLNVQIVVIVVLMVSPGAAGRGIG